LILNVSEILISESFLESFEFEVFQNSL